MSRLLRYFEAGSSEFEAYGEQELGKVIPENDRDGIHNMTAVSVEDVEGKICGILAGCNIKGGQAAAVLLKNMRFSFSMFCRNLKIYTEIREQGEKDALTGLYNRNRYEMDIPRIFLEYGRRLACIYIDVNGLHELNNTQGHDKGDLMLKTVAEGIRKYFDTEYIYRTGGDEFVVFVPDAGEADIQEQSKELAASLEKMDYHISVGIQWQEKVLSMSSLIKEAEKKMYAEKKRYYQQEAHDRRRTPRD